MLETKSFIRFLQNLPGYIKLTQPNVVLASVSLSDSVIKNYCIDIIKAIIEVLGLCRGMCPLSALVLNVFIPHNYPLNQILPDV